MNSARVILRTEPLVCIELGWQLMRVTDIKIQKKKGSYNILTIPCCIVDLFTGLKVKTHKSFASTAMKLIKPLYWHETHRDPNDLLHKTRYTLSIPDVEFNGCYRSTRTGTRSIRSKKNKKHAKKTTKSKMCLNVYPLKSFVHGGVSSWLDHPQLLQAVAYSLPAAHTRTKPQAAGPGLESSRAKEMVSF